MFQEIPSCCQNTGIAYQITVLVGDCFCPNCHKPIRMKEPQSGDYFFGQCMACGYYTQAHILLSNNGRSGRFEIVS